MAEKLDPRQVVTVRGTAPGDDVRAGSHTAGACTKGPADQRGGAGGDQGSASAMILVGYGGKEIVL